MTRLVKHSSQKFDINMRNIHKGILSCNLWHRAKFIGGMGPVQKAMGRTLFFYCFKSWGGYFFCSLQPWVGYFFPLP